MQVTDATTNPGVQGKIYLSYPDTLGGIKLRLPLSELPEEEVAQIYLYIFLKPTCEGPILIILVYFTLNIHGR